MSNGDSPGGLVVGEAAMQGIFHSIGENGVNAFLAMLGFRVTLWVISLIGVGYLVAGYSETRRAIEQATPPRA